MASPAPSPSGPVETLTFLGPAPSSEPPPNSPTDADTQPPSAPPPQGAEEVSQPPPNLTPRTPLSWPALSLHLAPPSQNKPPPNGAPLFSPPDPAILAALQAGRIPPPGASHPQAFRAFSATAPPPTVKPEPYLFSPTTLPRGGFTPADHNRPHVSASLDVREMIDALVVERLRELTRVDPPAQQSGGTWPRGGGSPPQEGSGHGQGGSPTSDQEGGSQWGAKGAPPREAEGGWKREPSRSRESEAGGGGRKRRGRSRSRSSSPHEAQGGHDRVGGNREAVRKYREKKKVEFASMQNQLAQLQKRVMVQDDLLRQKERIEEELLFLWGQVHALQEKVTSGQNLLVSELFAIKPPMSLR